MALKCRTISNMATIKNYCSDFLEHLEIERNRSQATLTNYRFYLERFVTWAAGHRVVQPAALTGELVRQYRLWLNRLTDARGEPLKKKSVSVKFGVKSRKTRWLYKISLLHCHPHWQLHLNVVLTLMLHYVM